VKTVSSD